MPIWLLKCFLLITLHYQHYHKALAPLDISRLVAYVDRFVVDGLIKELRLKRSLMLLQHEILSTLAKWTVDTSWESDNWIRKKCSSKGIFFSEKSCFRQNEKLKLSRSTFFDCEKRIPSKAHPHPTTPHPTTPHHTHNTTKHLGPTGSKESK